MFFILKSMHDKMIKAKQKEIEELTNKVERLELINQDLKEEIEHEHLENYHNHRTLLDIDKEVKKQNYASAKDLENRIRRILDRKEKELDCRQTY